MTIVLLTSLLALAQAPTSSREEQVLSLLRDLEEEEGSWHYRASCFRPWPEDHERQQLAASYFLFCGTGSSEIDHARFRRLGCAAMRVYGLEVERDSPWSSARISARIDGFDLERSIGFELRTGNVFSWEDELREDPTDALDDAELERLGTAGVRIHLVEAEYYHDNGDGFTPALAFLAGLVRFLNDVTDGEDVDLGGLLYEREATWKWRPELADGMRFVSSNYGPVLVVERPGTIRVPCDGASDFGPPAEYVPVMTPEPGAPFPASTRGAPSVVAFKFAVQALEDDGPRPRFGVRYRQTLDGVELVHEFRSLVALLPSSFDLARPFGVELELSPGRYSIYYDSTARLGAALSRK